MFVRVLVPVDLTERNRPAVELAAKLVSPGSGTVHLLHVIEVIPGFTIDEEGAFYGRLEAAATKHLARLAKPLQEQDVQVEADVVYGSRARSILDEAAKLDVDLIVIQSHRVESDRRGEGFGTLSHQIGFLASCPVLLSK